MAKDILGTGSKAPAGNIPVVTPSNIGKGLTFVNDKYDVNVGKGLELDSTGKVQLKISSDAGNSLDLRANGLYYGIQAPASLANLYVDPINGVDQHPDDVAGAGTRAKPLKTLRYALRINSTGVKRTIHLKEGSVIKTSVDDIRPIIGDDISVVPYGDRMDALDRRTFRYSGLHISSHDDFKSYRPRLIFDAHTVETQRDGSGLGVSIGRFQFRIDTTRTIFFAGIVFELLPLTTTEKNAVLSTVKGEYSAEEQKTVQLREHSYTGLFRSSSPVALRFDGCTFKGYKTTGISITDDRTADSNPVLINGNGASYSLMFSQCDFGGVPNDQLCRLVDGRLVSTLNTTIREDFITQENAKIISLAVLANQYAYRNITSNLDPNWFA